MGCKCIHYFGGKAPAKTKYATANVHPLKDHKKLLLRLVEAFRVDATKRAVLSASQAPTCTH